MKLLKIYLAIFFLISLSYSTEDSDTIPCSTNSECEVLQICHYSPDFKGGRCAHKSLSPIHYREVIAFLTVTVACSLAAVSGIGGGVFYMPIGLILFQFGTHEAVPLSEAIIFGVLLFR